jgi:hypothetical protein
MWGSRMPVPKKRSALVRKAQEDGALAALEVVGMILKDMQYEIDLLFEKHMMLERSLSARSRQANASEWVSAATGLKKKKPIE